MRLLLPILLLCVAAGAAFFFSRAPDSTLSTGSFFGGKNGPDQLREALQNRELKRIVQLLRSGVDPNAFASPNGLTALQTAASVEKLPSQVLDLLLHSGADPNARLREADTALHIAALKGRPDYVKRLIEAGAEVDAKNSRGETPLNLHCFWAKPGVVEILLGAGADPTIATTRPNGEEPEGTTPLHRVARREDGSAHLSALIQAGAPLDLKDGDGKTALGLAVTERNPKAVKMLLDAGANPNLGGPYQSPPLHAAVVFERIPKEPSTFEPIVRSLLDAGADLQARDRFGATPLLRAIQYNCSHTVSLLLKAGADVQDPGARPRPTPLELAIQNKNSEIEALLKVAGAS